MEAAYVSRTTLVWHLVICRKQKGRIQIVSHDTNLDTDVLVKKLKKISSFSLVITGKPVIHKKLSRFYDNPFELISHILPDAKSNEFCAQCSQAGELFHGSIVRSDVLRETLKPLSENRIFPQTILLGPPVLYASIPLLKENGSFSTSIYKLTIENEHLEFSAALPENAYELEIDGDRISSLCLPALCACLQAQSHYPVFSAMDDAEVKKVCTEAFHKKRFKKLLVALVVLIFVVTLSNFFFNRYYSEKYNVLDEQLALNRQRLNEIEKLEKDIGEKKSLLGKRPRSNGPVISLIGDRLASTIPAKIKLHDMEIFPVEGKITKEKPVGFSFNKVIIDGSANESDALDTWIGHCKKFDWVKDVLIVKYVFDKEKKKGLFKLEILLQ